MKIILIVIPVVSFIFAAINGRMDEMSESILAKSGEAVELVISICGVMFAPLGTSNFTISEEPL